LFVVDPDGGKPRKVLSGCVEAFAWSPDGNSIAVSRLIKDNEPDTEVLVLDLRSGRQRVVAKEGGGVPAWSPDGSKIAFEGGSGVYVVSSGGTSKPTNVSPPSAYWPAFSPDGRYVAFITSKGPSIATRIAVAKPDGSGLRYVTPAVFGSDVPVLWLPGGRQLVSAGPPDPSGFGGKNLLVVNVDGSKRRPIAVAGHGGTDHYVAAQGNGLIAYMTYTINGDPLTYAIEPDGSGKHLVTPGILGGWSPDAERLVFAARGGPNAPIDVINADGSGTRQIASARAFAVESMVAAWSSRNQIAYIDDTAGCGGPD
jgi:Tol biopolymer transport system component